MHSHAAIILSRTTIAAPCVWRTVTGVVAIRAYSGGEDPGRKRSRQFQRGFEAAADSFSRWGTLRRCGLKTRNTNSRRVDVRGLGRTNTRRWRWRRRRRTCPPHALPPAVFPHPGRSISWIAIGHGFPLMRAPVYRVPCNDWNLKSRLMLGRRVCVLSQKVNHFLVGGALYTSSMAD
jgi:hypothetical protein